MTLAATLMLPRRRSSAMPTEASAKAVAISDGLAELLYQALDTEAETPGRDVVRHIGRSLVRAMSMAREEGEPSAAQLVAAECVVSAETKDHLNWELIGEMVKSLTGEERRALKSAHEQVDDQEDEHLYHSRGWCRELWI